MRTGLYLFLAALSLHADGLTDLRTALASLMGDAPMKASLKHQFWQEVVKDKKPTSSQGQAQVLVEDGQGGLRLTYSSSLLASLAQEDEQQVTHPNLKTPIRTAVAGITAPRTQEFLSSGRTLLNELAGAQVTEDRQENWQGKPARLLLLRMEPKMTLAERKEMKSVEATGKLWLGPDGLPLAFWRSTTGKASKFFIAFETTETEEHRYIRMSNRLVTLSYVFESCDSAMGEIRKRKTTTTVSLM